MKAHRWAVAIGAGLSLGAAPTTLDTRGHSASKVIDGIERCAVEASLPTSRIGGKILKVATTNATLSYLPLGMGTSTGLSVSATKGTPKDQRAAARSEGRARSDALVQCALAPLDDARVERKEEQDQRQEERQERLEAAAPLLEKLLEGTAPPDSSSQAPASAPAGGEGFSGSCCIQGAFYACPSMEAVDTCSGAFMTCQSGCGFDMDCIERCSNSHPLDPSMCSRDSSQDATCK